MTKLIIITGLTGTGKSDLAVTIAKKYNGEIISADSVQIYKQLNIGSAKVTPEEQQGIPHHLIDIKNFDESYNVGEFLCDCSKAIRDIVARGKLPIICGGTGLYIKALMEGYTLGNAADLQFREKCEQLAKAQGNFAVWNQLNDISPQKAALVHPNNLKRVIRYLEQVQTGAEPVKDESIIRAYDCCCIAIVADRDEIYNKLNNRVDIMINNGLEHEISNLIQQGAVQGMQAFNSIGYKEWFAYFDGKQTKEKTIELIKQHNRNYCKRQLTFLKTIEGLKLLTKTQAKQEIERFLND